ncbi:cell envelope biogenesis protein OmpA [Streptomyces chattanoogensis]|uniref:cell envelope biogenesis protein OmpA n=1 Tax=Streptomyces chattanoogensis TaxID=66876 RepID=UPI00368076E0
MTSPIPERCSARPRSGGLVVPYVSLIHNGHAVFGSMDAARARHAFLARLCQLCSQPLDERFFVIVRPADATHGYSPEPGIHPECHPYAAAHCPMLNGTATRYRTRPVLATHPAGRPCTDPACPCPQQTPDAGTFARSGQPADRFEAWMIAGPDYRLITAPQRPREPIGIDLNVPIRRKRLLREATLGEQEAGLLDLLRTALGLTD